MSEFLRNTIRFALFILFQVFVLLEVPFLHRFITPYVYFLYIIWLPFSLPRIGLTLIGFLLGLTLDYFTKTPGLHAAPCALIAYLRPFIVNVLIRQDGADKNYRSPSITSMGWAPYMTLVLVLTFFHNGYLVLLEWLSFGNFVYFIGKVLSTTGVSILMIFITELLFFRKEKFRTNTA